MEMAKADRATLHYFTGRRDRCQPLPTRVPRPAPLARPMAVYLEVGSRSPDDLITCSDIDMMSPASDGRFLHKDGTPYPGE